MVRTTVEGFEAGVEYLPATSEGKPDYCEIDISAKEFWDRTSEEREAIFAALREKEPVSWQRPVEDAVTPDPDGPGYWAVVRHADITKVSLDNETFISSQGVLFDLVPPMFLERTQAFLAMDPPRHDKLRRLVGVAFTPKQIKRIEDKIRQAAHEIVGSIASRGQVEFVQECSASLPLRVFCDIFGVPEEDRELTGKAAADIVAWADPEALGNRSPDEVQVEAASTLHDIAERMIQSRRQQPTPDLMTNLVQTEVEGEHLDDFDIQAFFVLMAVAGTDTTKHTASHTVRAFTRFPEQHQWLAQDFDARIGTALEEFVRFASPVMTFRRTATREVELGGQRIRPGDKVVMLNPSGNWDQEVFSTPERFDLSRDPNPHLGYGGGGVHYCLGNELAKSMLRALFYELLTRIPDFEASEPEYFGTNFMRGVKRMKVTFTPEK